MSRRFGLLVLGGAAVLALVVGSSSLASQRQAPGSPAQRAAANPAADAGVRPAATIVRVVERAKTDTVIDLAPRGDSRGDTLAFGNNLFNAANARRIGRDEGSCVRTTPGVVWECSWTNILPGGHITVQGPFRDDLRDTNLSITGGTGIYRNVRGQMTLHARNAQGTAFDFIFSIDR